MYRSTAGAEVAGAELTAAEPGYTSKMKTIVTASPLEAAEYIRAGEVAAFPTETVYGLGADALRADAVRKIFDAKGRPSDNPLIIHICDLSQIDLVASDVPPYADLLISHFVPGPLTLVLRKSPHVPAVVTAGLDTVGIRMPAHETALAFLRACDTVVAAPSANRSGLPSPTTWRAVLADLEGAIPCILKNERSEIGLESTVVDCTGAAPLVLRSGAIGLEEIRAVVPQARHPMQPLQEARSPGLRHRHYAPRARVVLVEAPPEKPSARSGYIGLTNPSDAGGFQQMRVCRDVTEYAFELFDFFRACDAAGLRAIYCEVPPEAGIGAAVADRLRRAADASA